MNLKKILLVSVFMFLSSMTAFADVPPDAGFTRVYPNLIFEAREDFPDFRFFLLTPIDIEEISLKKGEPQTIEASGRGGPKRFLTLLAIPKDKLSQFGAAEKLSAEQLETLHQSVRDKKIEGVLELIKHTFQKDVPTAQKNNWKNPKYNLEKDAEKKIKAVEAGAIEPTKNQLSTGRTDTTQSAFALKTITAGILLSLAFAAFGIWAIRRRGGAVVRN